MPSGQSRTVLLVAIVAVAASAAWGSPSFAQGGRTVTGTVTDSGGMPIRYVRAQAGGIGALSNDSGRFVLTLESTSAVTLDIRRIGYRAVSVQLPVGGDTALAITLSPAAQRLASIRVVTEQVKRLETVGFYERLAQQKKWGGAAYFFTPEDIERRLPTRPTQLVDGFAGVRTRRGDRCRFSVVTCWVAVGLHNCLMSVYLDGHRLQPEIQSAPGRRAPVYVDEAVSVSEISAVEIYSRPIQAPPQYQSDEACGTILIWTK